MIIRTSESTRSARRVTPVGLLGTIVLGAGLIAVALSGCAQTAAPPAAPSANAPLHTASSPLGQIVVDGAGMTAYVFDSDTAGSGVSTCSGACASTWPAITTGSMTPEVEGITGTIGTIDGVNGVKQVTLNGLPLYRYAGDSTPGDVHGQGVNGIWWVVDATGVKVTEAPKSDRGY